MPDRFKNWDDYIDPRIEKLTQNGFYLEAFYLYAATIEYVLQESILYQEEWINHTLSISKSKLKLQKTDSKTLQRKTLGALISHFARYCKDKTLISQLNEFNSLRIKFIHYLMNHSIAQLNSEAKSKKLKYYKLVSKLCRYNLKILDKIIRVRKLEVKRIEENIVRGKSK